MMVTASDGSAPFTDRAQAIADAVGVALIDPYPMFAASCPVHPDAPAPRPTDLRHADESWSAEAHRVAARALYDVLID